MRVPVRPYSDEDNALRIVSFIRISVSPNEPTWSFPRHLHDDFVEISLVTNGSAEYECDHTGYTLRAGDLAIKNIGVLHAERSLPGQPYEQYCLGLSGVRNPGMPPNTLLPPGASPIIHTGEAFDYLRATIQYLFALNSSLRFKTADVTKQAIENVLSMINMLVMDAVESASPRHYGELTEKVLDYINRHFGEPIRLDGIARALYVSPSHLSHKFKEEVGTTVNQYLLSRRLGEAQMQLVFKDASIKEIAADCGYSNLQYFYSVFKKHVGLTPLELRDTYRKIRVFVEE